MGGIYNRLPLRIKNYIHVDVPDDADAIKFLDLLECMELNTTCDYMNSPLWTLFRLDHYTGPGWPCSDAAHL